MNVRHALAVTVLLAACGGEDGPPPALIPDFASRSPSAGCRMIASESLGVSSITTLRAISDSSMLIVDSKSRQLVVVDGNARVLARLELPEEGPGSVARLLDATASGDSLFVIADGGRHRLMGVDAEGSEQWSIEAGFPPQSVAFAGDRLLVAAVGLDPRVPGLLHERRGMRLDPLGVPFTRHEDALTRMFVNSIVLYGLQDGSAVAASELVWPRAWLIPTEGNAELANIPIPAVYEDRIGYVPIMPMREEEMQDLLVPVMGLTVDPSSRDIFFVTRAGSRTNGSGEKAIIRAAQDFSYLGSIRVPINAVKVAFLARNPDSLTVTDYDLNWYRCPMPARSGMAQ